MIPVWRAALWRRRSPSGGGWRWGGAPPPRTPAAATGSGGGHLQESERFHHVTIDLVNEANLVIYEIQIELIHCNETLPQPTQYIIHSYVINVKVIFPTSVRQVGLQKNMLIFHCLVAGL